MTTNTTFFTIPAELQDVILAYLDLADVISFRLTGKEALTVITREVLFVTRKRQINLLLEKEQADLSSRLQKYDNFLMWATRFPNEYRTYWTSDSVNNIHVNYLLRAETLTCYSCFQSLPRQCFHKNQCQGSRSLGHKDAVKRFCLKCAVEKGKWEPGQVIKARAGSGGYLVVCVGCKQLRKADATAKSENLCVVCYDERRVETKGGEKDAGPKGPEVAIIAVAVVGGKKYVSAEKPEGAEVGVEVAATSGRAEGSSTKERAGRCQRC